MCAPGFRGPTRHAYAEFVGTGAPQADRSELDGWLALWWCADVLSRALWSTTFPTGAVKYAWDIYVRFNPGILSKLPKPGYTVDLVAQAADDEPINPALSFSVEQIIEAFAVHIQTATLLKLFPDEVVAPHLDELFPEHTPAGVVNRDILREELNIKLAHPLAGALLDASLTCFVLPELLGGDTQLEWEKQPRHPICGGD